MSSALSKVILLFLAVPARSADLFQWGSTRPSSGRSLKQVKPIKPVHFPPFKYAYQVPPVGSLEEGAFDHAQLTERNVTAGAAKRRALRRRCSATLGDWCSRFERQKPIPSKPPPRGSKDCPKHCNGVGNCNYDTGVCDCPAGWTGPDCATPYKRPCTHRYRTISDPVWPPISSIGPDKLDVNWSMPGWTPSRCAGMCDDDIGICYCSRGIHRRIRAPAGSPPNTPPIQRGRPMADRCQPKEDEHGRPAFGLNSYADVYGPKGWCNNNTAPISGCGCMLDGDWGEQCEIASEHTCVSQCSGHGQCYLGFCTCHDGWYGQDCSRKKAGLPMEPSELDTWRVKLREAVVPPPAAADPPVSDTRLRPLIYVYDMPPAYTSRMLQYRIGPDNCMWRRFDAHNNTLHLTMSYSIEVYLHEAMLQSPHRTFDGDEADFFYVPMYITCFFWPIFGWADVPWWYAPTVGIRPMHGANMILEAKAWLDSTYPWWKRRQGRDHIWLMAHDEGACWMPGEVFNTSIILTHWGRMEMDHRSNTAYGLDNYTRENYLYNAPGYHNGSWNQMIGGHPCYDPEKDLIIPGLKAPSHYAFSPLMGTPPLHRDILLYFRGEVGTSREPEYSRGIRQKVYTLSIQHRWRDKYAIYVGPGQELPGLYTQHLARSIFCLVMPGDGFAMRAEDAVLHGCVPVVIMDNVHAVFESILDWDAFSIRIRESAIPALPEILLAVSSARLRRLQQRLATVWSRFAYGQGPSYANDMRTHMLRARTDHNSHFDKTRPDEPYQPVNQFPHDKDAFSTIIAWLYSRRERLSSKRG